MTTEVTVFGPKKDIVFFFRVFKESCKYAWHFKGFKAPNCGCWKCVVKFIETNKKEDQTAVWV